MVGNIVDVGWATIKSGCLPISGGGVCIYTVCNGGERSGLYSEHIQELYTVYLRSGLSREHIQELYTVYLTRFRTRGPQTDNTCRNVHLQVNM